MRVWRAIAAGLLVGSMAVAPSVLAQLPTPDPGGIAPGVIWTRFGSTWTVGSIEGRDLTLGRLTLAPGAVVPAHRHEGDRLTLVESGLLAVRVLAGDVRIGSDDDDVDDEGLTRIVSAGDWVADDADTVQEWRTWGDGPVVLLIASMGDADAEPFEPLGPAPTPTPRAPVVRRQVLSDGTGTTAERVTVRDRSGRLLDARMPTDAELRFATMITYPGLVEGVAGRQRQPVLVTWVGTICGPVVTIDIGADLSTIEVIDDSPGCDAAGVAHAVVLVFDARAELRDTTVSWRRAGRR